MIPDNSGRPPSLAVSLNNFSRGDNEINPKVVVRLGKIVFHNLQRMDRGQDDYIFLNESEFPTYGIFQVRKSSTLASSASFSVDRYGASDNQVNMRNFFGVNGNSVAEGPLNRSGFPNIFLGNLCRVEFNKSFLFSQPGNTHVEDLAGTQGQEPDGPLGRIRVGLDVEGSLPFG